MILSHRYKFIFIKTRKTAGTSVEIALSRFCGEGDIITPIGVRDEQIRSRLGYSGPRGHAKPWREYTLKDWTKLLMRGKRAKKFRNHMPASEIRRKVGEEIWRSYFKFSIERNPWDKAISFYYFAKERVKRRGGLDLTFPDFLQQWSDQISDFDLYSIDGRIETDYMILYESREEGLAEVSRILNLPGTLSLEGIRAKARSRTDRRRYDEFLSDGERQLIEEICHREITAFGYRF